MRTLRYKGTTSASVTAQMITRFCVLILQLDRDL